MSLAVGKNNKPPLTWYVRSSSHNHGSGKRVSSIGFVFDLGQFSTSMIYIYIYTVYTNIICTIKMVDCSLLSYITKGVAAFLAFLP